MASSAPQKSDSHSKFINRANRYSIVFKQETVKQIVEKQRPIKEVAHSVGVFGRTLKKWVNA